MVYRKPDRYYIDLYDRETIAAMKVKEQAEAKELATMPESDTTGKWQVSMRHSIAFDSFRNYGIKRSRRRMNFIQSLMAADERMDRLIEKTPIPRGIECNVCKTPMSLCTHYFDVGGEPILFVFECPNHHLPKRAIYPDGRGYSFPKRTCDKCGFEIKEVDKKT